MSTIPKASMANWLREQVILGARCTICGIVIDSDPAADDDRCTSHPVDAKDEEEAYLMSAAEELYSLFAKNLVDHAPKQYLPEPVQDPELTPAQQRRAENCLLMTEFCKQAMVWGSVQGDLSRILLNGAFCFETHLITFLRY